MDKFIRQTDNALMKAFPAQIINFGHIGDNNLHGKRIN